MHLVPPQLTVIRSDLPVMILRLSDDFECKDSTMRFDASDSLGSSSPMNSIERNVGDISDSDI